MALRCWWPKFVTGTAVLIGFFVLWVKWAYGGADEPVIRVALLQEVSEVSFGVSGPYEIVDRTSGGLIAVPKTTGETWRVQHAAGEMHVTRDGKMVGAFRGPVVVRETGRADGGTGGRRGEGRDNEVSGARGVLFVQVGGEWRRYRGDLEIICRRDVLLVVNELGIEEYLYGVVPSEMPYTWPQAALRAQAVAARTYALRRLQNPVHPFYHVCRTQSTQVYHGLDWERPTSNQAVDATRGQVLWHGGQPITAFYHSSSGGWTEHSEDVWQNRLPYIRGRRDPFDRNSRHYGWRVSFTAEELAHRLTSSQRPLAAVTDIEVVRTTASGRRVQELAIHGFDPDFRPRTLTISNADRVRTALGLKSALFELGKEVDPDTGNLRAVHLVGHGWGHGLGMSQYGARGMAERGFNHLEILHLYYSGVSIVPAYGR